MLHACEFTEFTYENRIFFARQLFIYFPEILVHIPASQRRKTNMTDYRPDICIYHDHCDDGFAAAWIIHQKWKGIDFRACSYNQSPPDHDITGQNIIIVDFSFPKPVLEEMAKRAASILVLDHHKTARAGLNGLSEVREPTVSTVLNEFTKATSNILVAFDMEKSGAMMAWEFCHPDKEPSDFIRAVQDRDLWKFELPDTHAIAMYLRSIERDFGAWGMAEYLYERERNRFLFGAKCIQDFFDLRVRELTRTATLVTFEGYDNVPLVHLPYAFVSETCNALLDIYPDAPFAVGVIDANGKRKISMRSRDERVDVSEIAEKRGGGGHRNAASFTFQYDAFTAQTKG